MLGRVDRGMVMLGSWSARLCGIVLALLLFSPPSFADGPTFKTVAIGNGITLHYAEQGSGIPVIFVHGSLSNYGYWKPQVGPFAEHYRVIAYSRRYNRPNANPPIAGYSAVTDSDDLAALIKTLHLGRVYVVGHSYGALTALFLEVRHPELLRAVVLAEPPAVPLLAHLSPPNTAKGQVMFVDIQKKMVAPMKVAFSAGHSDAGVGAFIDYVMANPKAWETMSAADRTDTLQDAKEWDVMLPRGTLFPDISPEQVRAIRVPTLVMTGGKSFPFLVQIDSELAKLISGSRQIVYPDAGHQMWYKHPEDCRNATEQFFRDYAR
jgi:pimeloyl-ACP methyl ester carboxylesterase